VSKPWPKWWRHKDDKRREPCRVMPWWECLDPVLDDHDVGAIEGQKFKIGAIVQIGWLLENSNGVWFGLAPGAEQYFEEVPAPAKRPPKRKPTTAKRGRG
jgi:hypothetical protein